MRLLREMNMGLDFVNRFARPGDGTFGATAEDRGSHLVAWHVTDDPSGLLKVLSSNRPLTEERERGDLGPGLYVSAVPEQWSSWVSDRFVFLDGISQSNLDELLDALGREINDLKGRHLTKREAAEALKLIRDVAVDEAVPRELADLTTDPWGIDFWKHDWLGDRGIEVDDKLPSVVKLRLKGVFAETSRYITSREAADIRNSTSADGAYVPGGSWTLPQMVVWDASAVSDWEIMRGQDAKRIVSAGGPPPLPMDKVRSIARDLVDEVVREHERMVGRSLDDFPLSSHTDAVLAEKKARLESVDGKPLDVTIKTSATTDRGFRDHRQKFTGAARQISDDAWDVSVYVPHDMPRNTFESFDHQFLDVLAHELTHVVDYYRDSTWEGGYLDDPHEHRAFMRQIAQEVSRGMKDMADFVGPVYDSNRGLFRNALDDSRTWNSIKGEVPEDARKNILKGVFKQVQRQTGMALADRTSSNGDLRWNVWKTRKGLGGVEVRLHEGSSSVAAGGLTAQYSYEDELEPECREAVASLEDKLDRRLKILAVWKVSLKERFRGRGLGVEMYARAAEKAAEGGYVLVPSSCLGSIGSTNSDAERVWDSGSLRRRIHVEDGKVMWGGKPPPSGDRTASLPDDSGFRRVYKNALGKLRQPLAWWVHRGTNKEDLLDAYEELGRYERKSLRFAVKNAMPSSGLAYRYSKFGSIDEVRDWGGYSLTANEDLIKRRVEYHGPDTVRAFQVEPSDVMLRWDMDDLGTGALDPLKDYEEREIILTPDAVPVRVPLWKTPVMREEG